MASSEVLLHGVGGGLYIGRSATTWISLMSLLENVGLTNSRCKEHDIPTDTLATSNSATYPRVIADIILKYHILLKAYQGAHNS